MIILFFAGPSQYPPETGVGYAASISRLKTVFLVAKLPSKKMWKSG